MQLLSVLLILINLHHSQKLRNLNTKYIQVTVVYEQKCTKIDLQQVRVKDCNLCCPDEIMFTSLFLQRLCVTIMQTLEVFKQFWIPELDDIHHYLAGLSTNALVGMGAFVALTTYWLAFRQKAFKLRVDPNQQSVELPVGGLFILAHCLTIQSPTHSTACVTGDPWVSSVWSKMNVQDTQFSVHSNKHSKLVSFLRTPVLFHVKPHWNFWRQRGNS